MKCQFTLVEYALMIVGINSTAGNKTYLRAVAKWEELLLPTEEEQELTGVAILDGGLGIPQGQEDVILEREMPLKALQTFLTGVDGCSNWQGRHHKIVLPLIDKLVECVKEEEAVVAWHKLPKTERERLTKAKEKQDVT